MMYRGNPQAKRWEGFCPLHEYARNECDLECHKMRRAWRKIIHDYGSYWHDRLILGRGYVSLAEERRCEGCSTWYKPVKAIQRFCSHYCRRRAYWQRSYQKKVRTYKRVVARQARAA